jgi:hypothetical protein
MSTQVTLTLNDELYENAKQWAALTQQDVSQILTDALRVVLTPIHTQPRLEKPVASLPDNEVLALSQVKMEQAQGERLGELLERQREAQLTDAEQSEMIALMNVYNQLWLRQSQALAEAVRRGLGSSLNA